MMRTFTMCRAACAAVALCAAAVEAPAQTFYEPVQSQYVYNGHTFYYGGGDARVFDHAARDIGRTSYTSVATQVPVVHFQRIYSDAAPYENLADNSRSSYRSFTAADAQNEANANVPCYFRKRDLLRAAVPMPDGSRVVPADAKAVGEVRASTGEKVERGMILIIPRKPAALKEAATVAMGK